MNIASILSNYFYYIIHPFKVHKALLLQRGKRLVLLDSDVLNQKRELNFYEAVAISWIFIIIDGIYSLSGIIFSRIAFLKFADLDTVSSLIPNELLNTHKLTIFISLMKICFFPLFSYVLVKFWSAMISMFSHIYTRHSSSLKSIEQVVIAMIPAYAFLVIPVFGEVFKTFAMMLYLFAGLKNNLGYNSIQSFLVVLSPLFILIGMSIFLLSFLAIFVASF